MKEPQILKGISVPSQQLMCFGSRRWSFIDAGTIWWRAFLVLQYSLVIFVRNNKYLKAARALLSVMQLLFFFHELFYFIARLASFLEKYDLCYVYFPFVAMEKTPWG